MRLTGLALAALVIEPLKSVIINENSYVNRNLGILFEEPDDWSFVSVKDFGDLKDGQIIGTGLNLALDEIWDDLDLPICIVTKYYPDRPEYKHILSPTITLTITPREELADLDPENFEELLQISE